MSHPGLRSIYYTHAEDDRLRELCYASKRSRDEIFDFLLKKQFNAVAADKSFPANITILPKGSEPQVLRTFIIKDYEIDRQIRAMSFDLSMNKPPKKRISTTDIYRTLVINGLDWYDSVIAAGKPTPRIPIDHEARAEQKRQKLYMDYLIKAANIKP